MYRFLYGLPLWWLCIAIPAMYAGWSLLRQRKKDSRFWRLCHGGVLLIWLAAALYVTIFSRETGNGGIRPDLFWSYRIAFLEGSYDYFQEIYLNVLAFFFFGLFAPELLKGKRRHLIVLLLGVAFSVGIEFLQFRMDVGLAEFDDVFSNALGTVIGILANRCAGKLWVRHLLHRRAED